MTPHVQANVSLQNSLRHRLSCISLCPAGDESYELYSKERDGIFTSLGYRAQLLVDGLNALPGISCNPSEGAMYAVRDSDSIYPTFVRFTAL